MIERWYRLDRKGSLNAPVGIAINIIWLPESEAKQYAKYPDLYTIEPVVIMTQAEYDALVEQPRPEGSRPAAWNQRAQSDTLAAGQEWLPLADGQHEFSSQEGVRINGNEFEARVIPILDREDKDGNPKKVMMGMEAVIISLPANIRLCQRAQMQPAALDMPDGSGDWWFNGTGSYAPDLPVYTIQERVRVIESDDALIAICEDINGKGLMLRAVGDMHGKWWRVVMPWEPRPAAPDAMPGPETTAAAWRVLEWAANYVSLSDDDPFKLMDISAVEDWLATLRPRDAAGEREVTP